MYTAKSDPTYKFELPPGSDQEQKYYGFVPISRELFGSMYATEDRRYSKFEAIIDLHQLAQYTTQPTTRIFSGRPVTWGYGQVPASIRFLEKRWQWSKEKVANFLKSLERQNRIIILQNSGQTVLELINYGNTKKPVQQIGHQSGHVDEPPATVLNDTPDSKSDTVSDVDQDTDRTPTRTTIKKVKKENKELIIQYAHSDNEFIQAYTEYMHFRKQKGKALVQTTITKQNEDLSQYSVQEAIDMINQSICNGWLGIFKIKNSNDGKSNLGTGEKQVAAAGRW